MSSKLIAETMKDLNKKAVLSIANKNYEEASNFFKQAYKIANELNLDRAKHENIVNIVNTEIMREHYDEALEILDIGMEDVHSKKNLEFYHRMLFLKSFIKAKTGDIDFALTNLKKILVKTKNEVLRGEISLLIFQIYADSNNRKADEFIKKAIQSYEKLNDKTRVIDCLQRRIAYYHKIGKRNLVVYDEQKIKSLIEESNIEI